MFVNRVVAVVLCAALSAAPAFAGEQSPASAVRFTAGTLPPVGPLQASIDRVRIDRAVGPRDDVLLASHSSRAQTSQGGGVLGRVVMAGVLGVAGFLGGGYLGAKIEGPCDCDDPGFKGAVIGAPIGAAVGAIAGWKLGGFFSR